MHDGFTRSGDRRGFPGSGAAALEDLEPRLLLTTYTVNTLSDVVALNGTISLREAILAANTNLAVFDAPAGAIGADTIQFNSSLFPVAFPDQTINFLGQDMEITESLTINGPLASVGTVAFSGSDVSRVFDITSGNVVLNRVTLTNGLARDGGGAIRMAGGGTLTMTNSVITTSFATNVSGDGNGGGILSLGCTLSLSDTSITNNGAEAGGGIYSRDGDVTLANVTITGNTASTGAGGGVYFVHGRLTATDGSVSTNSAATAGGGLYLSVATASLTSVAIENDTAGTDGGGIYCEGSTLTSLSTLFQNTATRNGGGLFMRSSSAQFGLVAVSSNNATSGAGVYQDGGSLHLADTVINNNTATDGPGGGIYATNGTTTSQHGWINGNQSGLSGPGSTAVVGGGGIYATYHSLRLNDLAINDNISDGPGGGLAVDHGNADLVQETFGDNISTANGGGVYVGVGGEVELMNCTVAGNTAVSGGGIYVDNGGEGTARSTIIANNTAGAPVAGQPVPGPDVGGFLSAETCLIESTTGGSIWGSNNIFGRDPMLLDRDSFFGCYDLLAGSPAIDAGANPTNQPRDERGWPRVFGARIDIGSVEHQPNTGSKMDLQIDGRHDVDTYHFGFIPTGTTKTVYFTMLNIGTASLNWTAVIRIGAPSPFSISPINIADYAPDDVVILPGRSYPIALSVTPTSGAAAEEDFVFGSDDIYDPAHFLHVTVNMARPLGGLTISDVSVTEGDSGTKNAVFTVALSEPSTATVTVGYDTADWSAAAGSDYVAASGVLLFNPGQTTRTIAVKVKGDTLDEDDKRFYVNLSNANGAVIDDGQGVGTIVDNDPLPSLRINDVRLTEGNSGTKSFTFTVSLSAASGRTVRVNYATADGTGLAPSDYTATSGTLTFTPGQTTKTVTVLVKGDTMNEADETFFVNLSSAENATIADAQGVGTIRNDDAVPSLSINDVTVTEGTGGTTDATFTVSLSGASGRTVTVKYATANGTAVAPGDYGAASGTLVFTPGETTQTIVIGVVADSMDEVDETFLVKLSSPTNATISDGQGSGTITDDDAPPTLSIDDVTVTEGTGGTRNAVFTVSLSQASGKTVTVSYATANGTATAGSDYTSKSGTLTFAPGQATRTISVSVKSDSTDEPDETFLVNLSTPTNATILDGQGVGTIVDDDGPPSLRISDVTVTEGNSGTANATFTVTLSQASGYTVTVDYATGDGTAVAGVDYTTTTGTLTFTPGQTSKTISVPVIGETMDEPDETFYVNLSGATRATIADSQGRGTIRDNDAPPTLSINDVTVTEGTGPTVDADFTVTLSQASGYTVTAKYATANGTALSGSDYTATSGTLTFNPGQTTQTVTVPVLGDVLDEATETYYVNLSSPTKATIADSQGLGRIVDDDPLPTLSINDVTVTEGNSGTKDAIFTVTLSTTSGRQVLVNYATASGTATAGSDFILTFGTLTFAAGQTTRQIIVKIKGDTSVEADETFFVNLSAPTSATILDGQGLGTIVNDD